MKPISNKIDKEAFIKAHEEWLAWAETPEGKARIKEMEEHDDGRTEQILPEE